MFLTSETCALDIVGAEIVRDLEPGEMIVITKMALPRSRHSSSKKAGSVCLSTFILPDQTAYS